MPKKIRKCSVCRKPGHTKKTCSGLVVEQVEKKIDKKSPTVLIKVAQGHRKSPHVVNLKTEREDVWKKVNVFQESGSDKKLERTKLDFAAMVKKANQEVKTVAPKVRRQKRVVPKIQIHVQLFDGVASLGLWFREGLKERWERTVQAFGNISLNYKRLAYSAIVIFLLVSLPFPTIGYYNNLRDTSIRVVEESTNAFLSLQSSTVAALQANIGQAQYDLNLALDSFGTANSILEKEHQAIQYVAGLLPIVGKQVTGRQHLLVAGHHLALGNTYLVKGINEVEKQADLSMTDKIAMLRDHLRSAIPQYEEALVELSSIDEKIVPVEYQQSFKEFKLLFTAFVNDMQDLVDLAQSLDTIFGSDDLRRYMLVFQNNHELRPTGGFMGSFAVMDVQKGKLMNLDIPGGGTYDIQGQLSEYVKPPLPLQLINKRWEFQDANWFPDFPSTAQKIQWFYEHGEGITVDGVIAINASVLERLLKVLGPISSGEYDMVIASDNALSDIQYQVEFGYDKEENKPKKVLSDLADQFLGKMFNSEVTNVVRLMTELHEALGQKEIQVYFNDSFAQNKLGSFGWTGELVDSGDNQDYLMVVNTNIYGQKSDAKIDQLVEHQAVVQKDGSVIDTVVVTRKHNGHPGEMFYGVNNVDYIRVYTPQGSRLVDAGGFIYPPEDSFKVPEQWYEDDKDLLANEVEVAIHANTGTRITNEFGKTAFGNWTMVEPGHTTVTYFVYKLPFKLSLDEKKVGDDLDKWKTIFDGDSSKPVSRYSLAVQKQSGIDSGFSSRIIYPEDWSPVWQSSNELELALNGAEFTTVLDIDMVVGVVMERNY